MEIYIVVVHDLVLCAREYAVLADSPERARHEVTNGHFIIEGDSTILDTVESKVISTERVGKFLEK